MRLLMVTASMDCGGAETHIKSLGEALLRQGHEVTVASADGRLVSSWLRAGGRHAEIPMGRAPLSFLRSFLRLRRLIRSGTFHLIHVHGRLAGILCHPLSKRYGVPMVSTVHAHFSLSPFRGLCRWGVGALAVSEDLKQYLCSSYEVDPEQVRVIPNGVDTEHFCPSARKGREGRRLLFLSRLDEDCAQGARFLCSMSERIRERFPDLEILIAGGGEALPRLKEKTREGSVRFLGYVEDPSALLRQVDAVLGVSRVALEAMASGTPVILGGDEGFLGPLLTEERLAEGERTNFCCRGEEPMTEERLWSALTEVFSLSYEERRRWGQRLRQYVIERHSLWATAEQTEAFYGEILRRQGHRNGPITVLCGYYGYGNLGDDTLLRAAAHRVTEEGGRAVALTKRGRRDEDRFGIPCKKRLQPLGILHLLRKADRLVLGGGTLLQENTSRRSLFYYTWIIKQAKRKGVAVELWANGLEAPSSRWGKKRMRTALAGCRRLTLRDRSSLDLAEALLEGTGGPSPSLEGDLVLGTCPCSLERRRLLEARYDLAWGRYLMIAPRGGADRRCLRILCSRVEALCAKGAEPLLISMYPAEDDRLCRWLSKRWACPILRGLGAEDLVGLMQSSQAVYGMRLHALILADCAGAPFLGFGNDGKLRSFCRERGRGCYSFAEGRKGRGRSQGICKFFPQRP